MIQVEDRITRCVLFSAVAFALVAVPIASGGAKRGADSLTLHAEFHVAGLMVACPPEAPPEAEMCSQRSGTGLVPGLGFVTEDYMYFVDENPSPSCGGVRALASTGQLNVSGKGTIRFDLAHSEQCVPDFAKANRPFKITGGSGVYEGAAGTGTVNHDFHEEAGRGVGTDTWSGSLDVPGHEFDLTPPTLSGLVNRAVRVRKGVKRVRVKYRVTAQDMVDGSVPARCEPGSGSRLRVGRTVVKCSATDTSANTATGSFRVVVKSRR